MMDDKLAWEEAMYETMFRESEIAKATYKTAEKNIRN